MDEYDKKREFYKHRKNTKKKELKKYKNNKIKT